MFDNLSPFFWHLRSRISNRSADSYSTEIAYGNRRWWAETLVTN